MKVNVISKSDFFKLALNSTELFFEKIKSPEAFIVKEFYPKEFILNLRNKAFIWGQTEEATWYPFYDDCPDYHRSHDNYPQAYVKQKFHGFYHHNYTKTNSEIFNQMKDIFILKNKLAGFEDEAFFNNKPSDGILPRINVHHYPLGGGYQAEHIDPAGPFAQIQTLIVASEYGKDFKKGGVYAREKEGAEKFYLDQHTAIGDLLVISPAIPHGVEAIDPEQNYSPNTNNGRWMILPLFLYSDYPNEKNIKPKQV